MIYISPKMTEVTTPKKSLCCGAGIIAEIEEWYTESGEPTEVGIYFRCGICASLNIYEETTDLAKWVRQNVRVVKRTEEEEREMFRRWTEGLGLPG